METVQIRAGELLLRPWRPDDARALHRACQDPELHRRVSGLPWPYEPAHAAAYVGGLAPRLLAAGTAVHLGIFSPEAGREHGLAGSVVLNAVDRDAGTAALGYWSAPWARGHRVAERAARALLEWAFGDGLGLARVDWRATIGNHASRLTALRLGFRIRPEDPSVGEVGYLVSPWARGRGYAPAAIRAVCGWGFEALGLARIQWRAEVGNHASRRAAEKAGFTVEGVLRQALEINGVRRDCWVGSLLKGEST